MSTPSLPSYVAAAPPSFSRTPSYTAEPQAYEQRLAHNPRLRPRLSGEFTKASKNGGLALRFLSQEEHVALPVYGISDVVDGIVDIAKTDGVHSVDVKIKGVLRLKEVAEGGTVNHELCISRQSLWNKDRDAGPCPSSLSFSLQLPTKFSDGRVEYPLPPTHEVHLSGLPGFRANVEYTVTATVDRGIVKKATSFFPKVNENTISTEFVYYPRSRPAVPLPSAMLSHPKTGWVESPEWRGFESVIPAHVPGVQDIATKLYIPASRVFSLTETIPFHLTLRSSAYSLAAFMPYGPTASVLNPNKQHTRISLFRQSIVDVRNTVVFGTKTDIWRVENVGAGTFQRGNDGTEFLTFKGEVRISDEVKVGSFRAGGLSVRDCLLLAMIPPDVSKSPFKELRLVVPIRLVSDPFSHSLDGHDHALGALGYDAEPSEYSSPSSEEDQTSQHLVNYRDL
ncbi:hypothetical protein BDW22DRAFT_1363973 [Trametopsis cervina]|nr:hypothetical protein BDW22DRAFT_1363973 [Trametopsis cervina]